MPTLARMYHWAQSSAIGEAYLPFSLTDMQATVEVACNLVGPKTWELFFGNVAIGPDEVIPMQLRILLFQQLAFYEAKVRGTAQCFTKEFTKEAEESQAALDEAGPRLRKLRKTSPYSR